MTDHFVVRGGDGQVMIRRTETDGAIELNGACLERTTVSANSNSLPYGEIWKIVQPQGQQRARRLGAGS